MPLTPVTPSARRSLAPVVALGASVILVGAGYLLGRAMHAETTVHLQQCDCPAPVVVQADQEIAVEPQSTNAIKTLPSITWASSVRGFSSQYTETSWSAQRVLGAPDVYPQHGDLQNAWASLTADNQDEWIEVGFAQPHRVSALEIYETYNAGAIDRIELVTTSGKRIVAPRGQNDGTLARMYAPSPSTGPSSQRHVVQLGCTDEPIVAVKVSLGSRRVRGWNELDAIGVAPCAEQ